MSRFFRVFAVILAVLAAPFLYIQGASGARDAFGSPEWNGFWQADIAQAFIAAEQTDGQLTFSIRDGGRELAQSAFLQEPLAVNGLLPLAVDFRINDDLDRMNQLIALGLTLDKRSSELGVIELEQSVLAQDFDRTFAIIDRLSITHPTLIPQFLEAFSSGLTQDDSLPPLRAALDEKPRWARDFWESIVVSEGAVANVLALRRHSDFGTSTDSDARLLAQLANSGQYAETMGFWEEFLSDGENATAYLPDSANPPIGWVANSSGERTFIDRGDGEFDVYVEDRTFGELSRQLVRLQPGEYRFRARIVPLTDSQSVDVALECATEEGGPLQTQTMDGVARFDISGPCEIYWIVLSGTAWERSRPLRLSMSDLEFTRPE